MPGYRIDERDLDRWQAAGLIGADARATIERELQGRGVVAGLTLTTLLYYSGGLLVIVAYGIFLGIQWLELNEGARIAIAVASLLFFAVVSHIMVRMRGLALPGELLQVVAVAAVPLLAFTVMDAAGWWPEEPGSPYTRGDQESYQWDLAWARMALAGSTVAAAAGAFWWSRSPFVMSAAVVGALALVIDAGILVQAPQEHYDWLTPVAVVLAGAGAATFVAGVAVRGRGERDYAFWLYVAGLAAMTLGLGNRAFDEGAAPGWGILWMIIAVAVLLASIPLQQRLLAAAGLLGIFAYLARLVFEVFESANAALVLIALGLLVLASGIAYQRLTERLYQDRASGRPA